MRVLADSERQAVGCDATKAATPKRNSCHDVEHELRSRPPAACPVDCVAHTQMSATVSRMAADAVTRKLADQMTNIDVLRQEITKPHADA
jgi:hypothetical protein